MLQLNDETQHKEEVRSLALQQNTKFANAGLSDHAHIPQQKRKVARKLTCSHFNSSYVDALEHTAVTVSAWLSLQFNSVSKT